MEIKLNIKNESVVAFLEERLLGYKHYDGHNQPIFNSGYSLLKDEMCFKKDCDISVGDLIRIELHDESSMSKKRLVNIYIYRAEHYDDVAIKMVLTGFNIEYIDAIQ